MASKQINFKIIFDQLQKDLENAIAGSSKKSQVANNGSDQIPRTSSNIRNKNVGKMTPATRSTTFKRLSDAQIEQQHDLDLKRPKRTSINDAELRYRCSFCSARFPLLTMVRDHTRACHRDENEQRREEKLNCNSTKPTSVVGNGTTGSKLIENLERKSPFLFRCNTCKFASVSYNHMIEHCQYHVVTSENPEVFVSRTSTRKCIISKAEYDVDFDTYNKFKYGSNVSYTHINCDYKLLKQNKWPGILDNLSKSEIDMINCNSIYYFTRIVRLTSRKKASSAPFMIFQCEKCLKHIDPHSILAHVVENSCNRELPEFPCYECKKPFLNENTMYLHYKMHQAAVSSNMKFRTVFFNHKDDDFFNALLLKAAGITMKNLSSRKKNAPPKILSDDTKAQTQGPSGSNFPQSRLDVGKTQIQVKTSEQAKNVQNVTELTPQVPNSSKFVQPRLSSDKTIQMQIKNSTPVKVDRKNINIAPQNVPSSQLQRVLTSGAAREPIQLKSVLESHDARSLIIPGTITSAQNNTASYEITSNETKETDKTTTVYKCQCDLCFHELENLSRHLGKCPSDKSAGISCVCGLVFDEHEYQLHYGIHSQGFTKLNVKKITMCDEIIIDMNNKINEKEKRELDFSQRCNKAISELIDTIQNVSLPHIRRIKTEVKEKIIAEPETRSVGSGDGLITVALKSQGTMTERKMLHTMRVHEVKQAKRQSVGTDTDDLNISVLKPQGTMTMIGVQTVNSVNNELCKIKQPIDSKSVCSGTDDLNKSVQISQRTITRTWAHTSIDVNKKFGNADQAGDAKSVDSLPDGYISGMKSQGQRAVVVPEIQTAYEVNKDKSIIKEDGKTMLVHSGAGDINISVMKSHTKLTNIEAVRKITKILSSCFKLDLTNAIKEKDHRLVDDLNSRFNKTKENITNSADGVDEDQALVETTMGAETIETVSDKTKAESTSNIFEKNTNISETKHEDHNKTAIKECYQIQKSLNIDEGKDALKRQTEKNKDLEKTLESEKNKDLIDTKQGSTNSKIYTEDELLNGPEPTEMSIYLDAEESLMTDDEDEETVLHYEDDDIED